MTPLDTLLRLNFQERNLDLIQRFIDDTLSELSESDRIALSMEQRQAELNARRAHIEFIKLQIASSN